MSAAVIALPRGQKRVLDGRQKFWLYPKWSNGTHRWVYAVGFTDGKTKLGVSRRPYARMVQHWTASEGGIQWSHLFGCYDNTRALKIERRAVAHAAGISRRLGASESFRGLDRDAAIRCVRSAIAELTV